MTTSAINSDIFNQYSVSRDDADSDPNKLLQDDFLMLMTEQLKHQDPMSPTDNGEFLGQMAQFSSAASMKSLQASFENFSSTMSEQTIVNAANLIDKEASLPTNSAVLEKGDKSLNGILELPEAANNVNVKIYNNLGEEVKTLQLGTQTAANPPFKWDGTDETGDSVTPGTYEFYAEYTPLTGGDSQPAITYINVKIESVSMNNGKATLNTADGNTHALADMRSIG